MYVMYMLMCLKIHVVHSLISKDMYGNFAKLYNKLEQGSSWIISSDC